LSCSHSFCGRREGPDARHGLMTQRKHNGPYIRDDHFTLQMIGQKCRNCISRQKLTEPSIMSTMKARDQKEGSLNRCRTELPSLACTACTSGQGVLLGKRG